MEKLISTPVKLKHVRESGAMEKALDLSAFLPRPCVLRELDVMKRNTREFSALVK
jgi:hypothetical protein